MDEDKLFQDTVTRAYEQSQSLLLALEYGFRAHEKGWNYERTINEFTKLMVRANIRMQKEKNDNG